jgi:hypothetical protein
MNSLSLCKLAGRYDNPIPTRFLACIDCLKIPALVYPYFQYLCINCTIIDVIQGLVLCEIVEYREII